MNENSTSKSFTVLIPDGESILSLLVVQCLAQVKKIRIVVLSNNKKVAIRFSRHVLSFYYYEEKGINEESRLEAIDNIIAKAKIDVVLPVGDSIIRLLSLHKDRFSNRVKMGLLPTTDAFDIANDKWFFYQWLKKNNFTAPFTVLFNENFKDSLQHFKYPVLAKPTQLTGGNGIAIFKSSMLLEVFLTKESVDKTYVVQDFIKGYDLGFNVLAFEGKIITHTIQKPIISSSKEFAPSYGLQFFHDKDIYKLFEEVILKLNWTGVANFDLRYDEVTNQIYIIEMNTRFWGNLLGSLIAGINFPYLSCLLALGIDLPPFEYKSTTCVTGKSAYEYWVDRFRINKKFPKFENSSIKFVVKDPGPHCFRMYQRVFR